MRGERILITGASGYLGRQVMARLPGIHLLVAQQFIQHTAVACQTIVRLGKIANP